MADRLTVLADRVRRISDTNAPWLRQTNLRRSRSVVILIVVYLGYFGWSVVAAVRQLVDPHVREGRYDTVEGILHLTLWTVLLLVSVIGVIAALRWADAPQALRWPRSRSDWRLEAYAVVLWALALLVGQLITTFIQRTAAQPDYPYPVMNGWGVADQIQTDLSAGPAEDLLFGACAVTLLRRSRVPWPVVVAGIVVTRGAFHLYYGWAVIGLLVWIDGAPAAYAVTGRIWAVVVLHS